MIELSEVRRTAAAVSRDDDDDDNVEACSRANAPRTSWVLPAMRRQNRCFGVAVTVVLIVATVYIVAGTYSEPDEYNVAGEYDSQFGAVSDQADNAKVQEALEKYKKNPSHGGGLDNPFNGLHGVPLHPSAKNHHQGGDSNPWTRPGYNPWTRPNQGEHGALQWMAAQRNQSDAAKWAAQKDRWDRAHPGVPFPYQQGQPTFDKESFMKDHSAIVNKLNRTKNQQYHGHPPANYHLPNRPHMKNPEDGNHALDPHEDTLVDPSTHAPMSRPTDSPVVVATSAPVPATGAPVEPTSAPVPPTGAPVKPTSAPVPATGAPVEATPAPFLPITTAPVPLTTSPVVPATSAPVPDTGAPALVTPAPVPATEQQVVSDGGVADYSAWHAATVRKTDGIKFETLGFINHDASSFLQGLTFNDGILYESTGLYGESKVRILDANTGQATKTIMIPGNEFGEGMAYYDGNLVQITWRAKKGHVYSSNDLTKVADFTYTTSKNDEGWGITYDTERNELIVTDGSNNLIIWDPQCWKTGVCAPIRLVPCVRLNGQLAKNLNEIEFWRGRVIANVWYEDVILVIHPETGVVEKEYDMSQLWPKAQRNQGADVLNGISVSEDPDVLYVSGKQWAQIFKLKLLV